MSKNMSKNNMSLRDYCFKEDLSSFKKISILQHIDDIVFLLKEGYPKKFVFDVGKKNNFFDCSYRYFYHVLNSYLRERKIDVAEFSEGVHEEVGVEPVDESAGEPVSLSEFRSTKDVKSNSSRRFEFSEGLPPEEELI